MFKQGFGPLRKVMEYEYQQCLGLFLLPHKLIHKEQSQLSLAPFTPTNATSQSRDTQMGSRPGHNKGVTIDQAIAICRACRPRPHGP